ncbi:MAG: hypothetical protein K2O47_00120 [Muribaculaceae bacterium]|nr:hypothetical protein [Muribaculaceae bacterium]
MTDSTYHKILEYFRRISEGTKWDGHLYAVGGCVRDEILGTPIHDVDIAVDLPDGGVNFTMWLLRHKYLLEMPVLFRKFGTARFRLRKFPEEEIEAVQTRAEKYTDKTSRCPEVVSGTIKEDCFRRDFTVNSLYRNIKTGEILDMTGRGIHDIKEGIIRTPLDPYETFDDDPVRILRCMRFAARYGWKIDDETMEALKRSVERLSIVSKERWGGEFRKMLFGKDIRRSLGVLDKIGGLKYMNPLIREMADTVPEGGDRSLCEMGIEAAARLEEEGVDDEALRLAAFFGNLGMLRAAVRDRSGVMRYPRHEHTGGLMASKLLKHMGFDKHLAETVRDIIQGRGEVRRKSEKRRKMEEHRNHQRRQMEEKAERKKERAIRHRDLLAAHRRNKKRSRSRSADTREDTGHPSTAAGED